MPQKRVTMRNLREILRLAWSCGQSRLSIAKSCGIGKTTVTDAIARATVAKLPWPLPPFDDEALERLLYPPVPHSSARKLLLPNWSFLHDELASHKNLTLMRLWQSTRNLSRTAVSGFCRFLIARKYLDISLLPVAKPKVPERRTPHIYSLEGLFKNVK